MTDPKFEKIREKHGVKRTKGRQTSVLLHPIDFHELEYLQGELGVSQGEIIRSAVRAYAALVRQSTKGR